LNGRFCIAVVDLNAACLAASDTYVDIQRALCQARHKQIPVELSAKLDLTISQPLAKTTIPA
jgi:hypothetical protein